MEIKDFDDCLNKFLKAHNFPEDEAENIMRHFRNLSSDSIIYDSARIIDYSLGWRTSKMSVAFYYFNQLRWALFFIKSVIDDTKIKKQEKISIVNYLKSLSYGYLSRPDWRDCYKTYEEALSHRYNEYDLIITDFDFNKKREYFRKIADNYEKYYE